MNALGKIRKSLNTIHISELISIEKLNDKDNHLYKEYMLSVITYEDIIKEYPFLKGEPLYMSKSISNPCYYYDKESLFPISLYPLTEIVEGKQIVKPTLFFAQLSENAEDTYKEKVKLIKDKFKQGKGFSFIDSDTMAFEFLNENIAMIEEDKLFDTVMDMYTSNDYGFGFLEDDAFKKVVNSRKDNHLKELYDNLSDYSDEITVYRGEGEFSTENGYSYSSDINVAVFFATRFTDSKRAKIVKGKVKKEDVIWYDNGRNEKEIIVYPEKVYDKEEISLFTVFDDEVHLCMDGVIDFYQVYRTLLKEFPYTHKGDDHNKEHMLRVLFLGLLISTRDCPEVHIDSVDAHTLAIALTLHDIGRNNDSDDAEHGILSYEVFKKNFRRITKADKGMYNDEWVKFLMEYHCKDDDLAIKKIKSMNLSFSDRVKLISFYNILKDADALDRVRFGFKCLDVNYLRLKNSIKYVLLAHQLKETLEL